MECPNCGFQNLPGLTQCARCAGRLRFDDVDIHPYRAGDGLLMRIRRRRAHARSFRAFRAWVDAGWQQLRRDSAAWFRRRSLGQPSGPERVGWIVASLIPGLGHIWSGRRRKGFLLMGAAAATFVLSLLLMWVAWSLFAAIFLGLQVYAITDCVFFKGEHAPRRTVLLVRVLACFALFYVYWGAGGVLSRLAQVYWIGPNFSGGLLETNDVVLVPGPWLHRQPYAPGDIVFYDIGARRGRGWYIREGTLVDRIVAGPGARVAVRSKTLFVNGRPIVPAQDLLATPTLPRDCEFVVPEDSFFIPPAMAQLNLPQQGEAQSTQFWEGVSIVPRSSLRGKATMIIRPPGRVRRL